ncbi:PIN domain-containing protein [Candidatus Poribacteria bacterium]|nr:PIN domain-containing protein [Candidatus Poribacteria bacterium]
MRIYLDVCCLNRPFDDQVQDRVRLESEAVLAILSRDQIENWILLGSEVIDIEIAKIPDNDRKQKVRFLYSGFLFSIVVDENIEKRARELEELNFALFDALHIACAEKGKADVLLTTDDDFLRRALRNKKALKVRVENPVRWLMEEIENEYSNIEP